MRRRGTALVEFALTLPLFLALLLGIVDIGWLYNHQLILTNAAREGARLGALGATETEVRSAVLDYLNRSGYTPMPPSLQVTLGGGLSQASLNSTVPLLFASFGPDMTIRANSTMRRE